jgi:uncharacterized membrane protein YtjA (UPF0391 family)
MLRWSMALIITAILVAILGFSGVTRLLSMMTELVFLICIILFILSLVIEHLFIKHKP